MGGESKARGTKEERVAKALERKMQEELTRYEWEVSHCFYQREIEENTILINRMVLELEGAFLQMVYDYLTIYSSKINVGDVIDFYKSIGFETKLSNAILKKVDKFKYRLAIESGFGLTYIVVIKNGTTWNVSDTGNKEILEKIYHRACVLEYCKDKLDKEFNEKEKE